MYVCGRAREPLSAVWMAGWFWGDFWSQKWLALKTCLNQRYFQLHFRRRNSPSEKESWSKGGFSFSPCVTLTLCLSLEPDPAVTLQRSWAHSFLCPTFLFGRAEPKHGGIYLGDSITDTISYGNHRAWGRSPHLQRAFLSLHLVSLPGNSRMGDLGLPRSSTQVWLHRIRIWVFLCIWQNVNQDSIQ